MKIYVASSWRNNYQPEVVKALREDGHEVYDFKDADGFHWTEVDEAWQEWPKDIPKYLAGLDHPCAMRGFNRDMSNLIACEACVYVMPCGVSASLEAGWACGSGRLVIVYVPGLREPDLMVKMAHLITDKLEDVRERLLEYQQAKEGRKVADGVVDSDDAAGDGAIGREGREQVRDNEKLHECEQIRLDSGVVTVPESIEEVGECRDGCCTDYRCKVCGRRFRIEWPD